MNIFFIILGAIGLVLISIGIWVRRERRQDLIFILGGVCLLIYSIYREDWVFIVLQVVFIFSVLYEFIKLRKKKR